MYGKETALWVASRLLLFTLTLDPGGQELLAGESDYRTPRAGEAVTASVFGLTVHAPERDRRAITYLSAGAVLAPDGPEGKTFGPMGGLYIWKVPSSNSYRLRAIVAVISNELRWDRALPSHNGFSFVASFDSLTLPWARMETIEGVSDHQSEMEWHQLRAGVGFSWRKPWPADCDNGLDVALTFEPGVLWFAAGDDTARDYVLPSDALEGRLHLRIRADALERNIVELPHRGWSLGADAVAGYRHDWKPWGLPATGLDSTGSSWVAASMFAFLATTPFPGVSERHRLVSSLHAGGGAHLDRFSAFRLGGGSTWGDFETLSRIVLPGAGVDELFAPWYIITDIEYRFEAFFFLYLQLRGTLAWAALPSSAEPRYDTNTKALPALTLGLTSGLPWGLSLEAAASWNFGIPREEDGEIKKGGTGLVFSLTKEF